nr:WYL domain-containing protein [uncultured Campylobacter sp.]
MSSDADNKTIVIFEILKKLVAKQEIYLTDTELLDELRIKERTLRRYMGEIDKLFPYAFRIESKLIGHGKRPVKVLRVYDKNKDIIGVLKCLLEYGNDLGWLISLLNDNDPRLFNDLDKHDKEKVSKQLKEDSDIFLFRTNPLEVLQDELSKRYLSELRNAVKNKECRNIKYKYIGEMENLIDAKCLKIVFTDNNWYLAIEDVKGNFRLLRVAFIISLSKSSKKYEKTLKEYETYFNKIQNAMSLPSETTRRALLKASPKVAIYFKEGMKLFFPTQKFKKKLADGSIIFSIDFTQDMEILPFIKKWLPDIEILEPKDLRETFKEQLKAALDILSK